MDNTTIILDSSDSETSILEITHQTKVRKSTRWKEKDSVIVISDSSDCEIVSPLPATRYQKECSLNVSIVNNKRKCVLTRSETLRNNSFLIHPKPSYSVSMHSANHSKLPSENQTMISPQNKANGCHHNQTKPSKNFSKRSVKTLVKHSLKKHTSSFSVPSKAPTRSSPRISSQTQTRPSFGISAKALVSHTHCTAANAPVRHSPRIAHKSTTRHPPRTSTKHSSKNPISLLLKSAPKILKMFSSESLANMSNKIPNKSTKRRRRSNKVSSLNHHINSQSINLLEPSLRPLNNASNLDDLNSLLTFNHCENVKHNNKDNGTQTQFCCPVINCEIKFSSRENLQNHMYMMIHNSCNPLKNISDSFLSNEIINYICPKCGIQFKLEQMCLMHQKCCDHNIFIKPIPISSYICQTCLLIFPSKMNCVVHMKTTKHYSSAFNFRINSEFAPVPLPKVLEVDFARKCEKISNYITCTNCSDILFEAESVIKHVNDNHVVKCVARKSLIDIFSNYLGDIICSSCQQIIQNSTNKIIGKKHQCTSSKSGIILENSCKSFREFVLRSSLRFHLLNLHISSADSADLVSENNKDNYLDRNLKTDLKRQYLPFNNRPSKRRRINTSENSSNVACSSGLSKQFSFGCRQFNPPVILNTQNLDCYKDNSEFINKLTQMKHIIFLDLDNWLGIFKHIHDYFPKETFLWAFYGAKTKWLPPKSDVYLKLVQDGCFFLNPKSGCTKQAADFAIVLHVGKMDERLPKHIKFTILSGDKGFYEVSHQFENSKRQMQIVNPHHFTKESYNSLFQPPQV